jgi:hypothetical protein
MDKIDRLNVGQWYNAKQIPHELTGKREATHNGADGRIYTFEFEDHPELYSGPGESGELARNVITRNLPVSSFDTLVVGVTDMGEVEAFPEHHQYEAEIFVHGDALQR